MEIPFWEGLPYMDTKTLRIHAVLWGEEGWEVRIEVRNSKRESKEIPTFKMEGKSTM